MASVLTTLRSLQIFKSWSDFNILSPHLFLKTLSTESLAGNLSLVRKKDQ